LFSENLSRRPCADGIARVIEIIGGIIGDQQADALGPALVTYRFSD
jgi:hypothetical protein